MCTVRNVREGEQLKQNKKNVTQMSILKTINCFICTNILKQHRSNPNIDHTVTRYRGYAVFDKARWFPNIQIAELRQEMHNHCYPTFYFYLLAHCYA